MTTKKAFGWVVVWIMGVVVGIALIARSRYVPGSPIDVQTAGAWKLYMGGGTLFFVLISFLEMIREVCHAIKAWWNAPVGVPQVVNPRLRAQATQPSRFSLLARNAQLMAERRAEEEKRRELLRDLDVNVEDK